MRSVRSKDHATLEIVNKGICFSTAGGMEGQAPIYACTTFQGSILINVIPQLSTNQCQNCDLGTYPGHYGSALYRTMQ